MKIQKTNQPYQGGFCFPPTKRRISPPNPSLGLQTLFQRSSSEERIPVAVVVALAAVDWLAVKEAGRSDLTWLQLHCSSYWKLKKA